MIGGGSTDTFGIIGSESASSIQIAVRDEDLRTRLRGLLDSTELHVRAVKPRADPFEGSPTADLIVVRRRRVRAGDLRSLRAHASSDDSPGVIVLADAITDGDRARLMAAGASCVLATDGSDEDLRGAIESVASTEGRATRPGVAPRGRGVEPRLRDFLSKSPRMKSFLDLVSRVVDTDSSLLITGETGVGKERLAHAIHNESHRREGPFVTVNCGALPEQLLESELFGHESGAFTGADRRRKGRFELAQRGTIFLDEIAEMPVHLQVNLLTVLQSDSVKRVGGEKALPIDVRVMAATNRDVTQEVREGRLREDLYYRLFVVGLEIPPLRERREDIPDLAGTFISHFRVSLGRRNVEGISDEALQAMLRYEWPGNVRELVNTVEHATVLCRSSQITTADLPDTVLGGAEISPARPASGGSIETGRREWMDLPLREARRRVTLDFEREYLDGLLADTGGRIGETAARAGITARSLYGKMKRHGLRKEDYR